jgi:3-hydroxy acid dehydrogenase/malonic semialdehyde reductase
MTRLENRLALVTGATSGIGAACAEALAKKGCRLAIAARRGELLGKQAAKLLELGSPSVTTWVLDVRERAAVADFAERLIVQAGTPDILINNAGLARGLAPLQSGDIDEWEEMIDTNVKGLLYVTRAILPLMVARDSGHVVNIGSLAGLYAYPNGNVYCATKFAVNALTQTMNIDLAGTAIRATEIDPGATLTNFSVVRFGGDEERAAKFYDGFEPLGADDIAAAVMFALEAPPNVNVQRIVITPVAQRNSYVTARKGK